MNPLQSNSLPPSYFDKLYSENPDPWKFETSVYEANKYAATIAALPKERYRAAFEIGGSIGVLTEKLQERCDSLLSQLMSQNWRRIEQKSAVSISPISSSRLCVSQSNILMRYLI